MARLYSLSKVTSLSKSLSPTSVRLSIAWTHVAYLSLATWTRGTSADGNFRLAASAYSFWPCTGDMAGRGAGAVVVASDGTASPCSPLASGPY